MVAVVLLPGHVGSAGVVPLPGAGDGAGEGVAVSPAQLAQSEYEADLVSASVKPNKPNPVLWKTGTADDAEEGLLGVLSDVAHPVTATSCVMSKVLSSTDESTQPLQRKVYEK